MKYLFIPNNRDKSINIKSIALIADKLRFKNIKQKTDMGQRHLSLEGCFSIWKTML